MKNKSKVPTTNRSKRKVGKKAAGNAVPPTESRETSDTDLHPVHGLVFARNGEARFPVIDLSDYSHGRRYVIQINDGTPSVDDGRLTYHDIREAVLESVVQITVNEKTFIAYAHEILNAEDFEGRPAIAFVDVAPNESDGFALALLDKVGVSHG